MNDAFSSFTSSPVGCTNLPPQVDYRGEAGYSQELRQAAEMEAETENHSISPCTFEHVFCYVNPSLVEKMVPMITAPFLDPLAT